MALKIITADERVKMAAGKNSIAIFGEYGIGKTTLVLGLPESETLFLDFESGSKSIETFNGDTIELRTFEDAQDIACLLGGPDPAAGPREPYCQSHYDAVKEEYKAYNFDKYRYVFFDSISEMTARAKLKARNENWTISKKTNEVVLDGLGVYGDLANDVLTLIRHMQHERRTIIFVGRLESVIDEFKREVWQPQLDGSKIGRELPGIVDQVICLATFDYAENIGWTYVPSGKGEHRAFCCRRMNPWGLPAKERTVGRLELIEEPDLMKLIKKINEPTSKASADAIIKTIPQSKK